MVGHRAGGRQDGLVRALQQDELPAGRRVSPGRIQLARQGASGPAGRVAEHRFVQQPVQRQQGAAQQAPWAEPELRQALRDAEAFWRGELEKLRVSPRQAQQFQQVPVRLPALLPQRAEQQRAAQEFRDAAPQPPAVAARPVRRLAWLRRTAPPVQQARRVSLLEKAEQQDERRVLLSPPLLWLPSQLPRRPLWRRAPGNACAQVQRAPDRANSSASSSR